MNQSTSPIPDRLAAALADRYRFDQEIGAGGMATVYLAEDLKHQRKVALKVLRPELAAALGHERFLREITTTANLRHPHILPLYDSGEAGGFLYYVMPYVEGASLRERLTGEKQLPLDDALQIAREVADALSYAHSRGVIHRDIKPENILLESGHAVVSDFGIAKAVSAAGGDQLTKTGVAIGTPFYMSPEQAVGDEGLDGRSDLYALGCVLYEMLAGQPPFTAPSLQAVIAARFTTTPPEITATRPETPRQVSNLLRLLLSLEPGDRPTDAKALADGLRVPRGGASIPGPGGARQEAVGIAVLPFADLSAAGDQEYFCEGMAEEIMNALAQVEGVRVASRTSSFRARQEGQDLQAVGRMLGVDQVLEGSVRTAGKRLRLTARLVDVATGYQQWSERYDREIEDVFALQDDIAAGVVQAITAELTPEAKPVRARAQVQNLEAYQQYLKGRHYRYTKNDHGNALRCFERAVALDPSHAASWLGLAEVTVLAAVYSLRPARDSYAAAKEALATAMERQGESADTNYVNGMIAFCEREWTHAEAALLRAIELDGGHVQALCWLGLLLASLGRYTEVEARLQHAHEVDVLAPYPYAMTGVCLVLDGQFAASERFFEQALAFEAENSLAQWGWAIAKIGLGHPDEAVALLERASVPSHRGGLIHGMLGWALAEAGRPDEARVVLTDLLGRAAPAPAVVPQAWLMTVLGDLDPAWSLLEEARAEQQLTLVFTRVPVFPALQRDPRFPPFMARLGVPV